MDSVGELDIFENVSKPPGEVSSFLVELKGSNWHLSDFLLQVLWIEGGFVEGFVDGLVEVESPFAGNLFLRGLRGKVTLGKLAVFLSVLLEKLLHSLFLLRSKLSLIVFGFTFPRVVGEIRLQEVCEFFSKVGAFPDVD